MMATNHFFRDLRDWIAEMDNPRNQSYITYQQTDLNYMAILKNVCGQYSMRSMEERFNNQNCIRTLSLMSGNQKLEEMPHYDTLNCYLERLSPECLSELRKKIKFYYHKVLEAKIVLCNSVVISLGTECIENEKEDVSKQDCEITAAERLMAKIKKEYPRLPICMQGDTLYAAKTIMQLCRNFG